MTDNEIIKALECCLSGDTGAVCTGCPFTYICGEDEQALLKNVLDLINRQKAEIERLQKQLKEGFDLSDGVFEVVKSEAYREFNARLYAYKTNIFIKGEELMIIPMSDYDEILKELTESNE